MCGIAGGWVSTTGNNEEYILNALAKISHRGPDDRGYEFFPTGDGAVFLAHTRLSIIDLTPAGHQPMHSHDGRWAIVFNGEIYNYRELRSELKALGLIFKSESDTEVLINAWAAWGISCLPRLIGMFAFVILDKSNGLMTCVRDAFGIKPFFYKSKANYFAFASEIPALNELIPERPHLNWQRAYDYLVHGDYDTGHETFFEDVMHLPSGHLLEVNTNNGLIACPKQWWVPKVTEKPGWSYDDAVENVREQFLKNIRLHLRSDVSVGAALSGGIDSSAVVCAMRHLEPDLPIHTFSFIAENSSLNEEHWIDKVNNHVGSIPHKVLATGKELINDIEDMIRIQGEPFSSTSIYAQYRVFKLSKENGIKVTLDGQGADEILAGYDGYPGQKILSLIEKGDLQKAFTFFLEWSKWPGRNKLLAAKYIAREIFDDTAYELLRKLDGRSAIPNWIDPRPLVDYGIRLQRMRIRQGTETKGRRVVGGLALALSKSGLIHLLRHADRNSMRFSIESRVPFLTVENVDLLLSMPEEFLISNNGESKRVFRSAMRGLVPDEILDRKDKIGFATPECDWLLSEAKTIRNWLSEDLGIPFINQKNVLKNFDDVVIGKKKFTLQVWRWVNFYQWYKNFNLANN